MRCWDWGVRANGVVGSLVRLALKDTYCFDYGVISCVPKKKQGQSRAGQNVRGA